MVFSVTRSIIQPFAMLMVNWTKLVNSGPNTE